MKRQFAKDTISCIGIIVGLSVSVFLLVKEMTVTPVSYASAADSSVNLSDKKAEIQYFFESKSIYSDFFFGANKKSEPVIDTAIEKIEPIKSPTPNITFPKSSVSSCIKIPENILVKLKGAPTPPDGKMKDGKLVCHVLADGKKDNPHKSNKNPKGEWGGCCYDPDEIPNPKCCYPVGSVYEKYLSNYFKNPFPHRK